MKILFENPQFLVIDKPAGWLSVPGRQGEDDVRPCLGRELEKTHGRIWPVHRLDLEVSGLILYARTAAAHREASMAFERHRVQKTYQAFTAAAAIETLPAAAKNSSERLVEVQRVSNMGMPAAPRKETRL